MYTRVMSKDTRQEGRNINCWDGTGGELIGIKVISEWQ
jgi:hypothetical protein